MSCFSLAAFHLKEEGSHIGKGRKCELNMDSQVQPIAYPHRRGFVGGQRLKTLRKLGGSGSPGQLLGPSRWS